MVRSTSSGLSTYYYYAFGFFWIIFYPFPIIKLSPFYLITSPVPTCLVHNCETSWRLFYPHLLSPLSQDQIPFDPHHHIKFPVPSSLNFFHIHWPLFHVAILMFQQEFALRLVARSCSDITILSKKLIIFEYKLYAKVDNTINVSRNDFCSPPQVESSVILLVPLDPPPLVKL